MLDPALHATAYTNQTAAHNGAAARPRPVFRMIENDRMGGSVPAWIRPDSAQEKSVSALAAAGGDMRFADEISTALAYQPAENTPTNINQEPFGFTDLIDIVNPLHHIPLVGTVYRELTGDQIRPSSQIIGGTLFGGVVGAASGIANVIVKEETGRDVAGHALNMAGLSQEDPAPVTQLAAAESPQNRVGELPASALSFVDLSHIEPAAGTPRKTLAAKPSAIAAQYRFND